MFTTIQYLIRIRASQSRGREAATTRLAMERRDERERLQALHKRGIGERKDFIIARSADKSTVEPWSVISTASVAPRPVLPDVHRVPVLYNTTAD